MPRKIAKSVRVVPQEDLIFAGEIAARLADQAMNAAQKEGGMLVGPPVVKILVEQEFVTRG